MLYKAPIIPSYAVRDPIHVLQPANATAMRFCALQPVREHTRAPILIRPNDIVAPNAVPTAQRPPSNRVMVDPQPADAQNIMRSDP